MEILSFLGKLLTGIAATILPPRAARALERLGLPRPARRYLVTRRYLTDLPDKLRKMPFIYKGIETDVLNDFVEIDFERLEVTTLQRKPSTTAFSLSLDDLLRDNKCVLFVGNAGIGKTTLMRYHLLHLLGGTATFLHSDDRHLPLYIPLKLVPNRGSQPIRDYVLNGAPFLGDLGYLEQTMATTGLLLCLDGYDEIGLTGSSDNYIRRELEWIFFGAPSDMDLPDSDFYKRLSESRIWLTSRPQFLQFNAIDSIAAGTPPVRGRIACIEVSGIGSHRESLAKSIFDRYAATDSESGVLLNTEYFIQQVDRALDVEVRDMSFNPLFLTVMCYNYARLVLDRRRHDVPFRAAFDDLILECVDLLLIDIDEFKARQLTRVESAGILNRRNELIDAKRLFLRYFAAYSYVHAVNVFSEERLEAVLNDFVTDRCALDVAEKVRLTFRDADSDRPTFVRQLIYCGLFVLVDVRDETNFYDFPHRRFREVLASSFLATPSEYLGFLKSLSESRNANLVELISVLKRSPAVKNDSFQYEVCRLILDDALHRPDMEHRAAVSREFCDLLPSNCDLSSSVRAFITAALKQRRPSFSLSIKLLTHFRPTPSDLVRLQEYLRERVSSGDDVGVALGCALLSGLSAELIQPTVVGLLRSASLPREVRAPLYRCLLESQGRDPNSVLSTVRTVDEGWDVVAAACTSVGKHSDVIAALRTRSDADTQSLIDCYVARTVSTSEDWNHYMAQTSQTFDLDLVRAVGQHRMEFTPNGDGVGRSRYFVSRHTVELVRARFDSFRRTRQVIIDGVERREHVIAFRRLVRSQPRPEYVHSVADVALCDGVWTVIDKELNRLVGRWCDSTSDVAAAITLGMDVFGRQLKFVDDARLVAFAVNGVVEVGTVTQDLSRYSLDVTRVNFEDASALAKVWASVPMTVPPSQHFFV